MIQHQDSHIDHDLSEVQICYLLERFAHRRAFFLETLELPEKLGTVPCALWGPSWGIQRSPRTKSCTSRVVHAPGRHASSLGPHVPHASSL